MNDYDAGVPSSATEQAEYEAWQQMVDEAQQQHAVKNVDGDTRLNRGLWVLAEKMATLKA